MNMSKLTLYNYIGTTPFLEPFKNPLKDTHFMEVDIAIEL